MAKSKPATRKPATHKPDTSKTGTGAESPAFEEAMGELEGIVRSLEGGGETLEKALEDYSKAIGLLKICHQKLAEAERRVEILSGVDAEGNPLTEPVEETRESLEEKRHSRSTKRSAGKRQTSRATSPSVDADRDERELF